MGYTTDFTGVIKFDKPLPLDMVAKWQAIIAGQWHEETTHQRIKREFPSLLTGYCQWEPAIDREGACFGLCWDGNEKFYNYVDWLNWLMDNLIKPAGVVANGEIEWVGEDNSDLGCIFVKDNEVTTKTGRVTY